MTVSHDKQDIHCIVLHCIVLHCIVLYCIALHCIALYCIVLYCGTGQAHASCVILLPLLHVPSNRFNAVTIT